METMSNHLPNLDEEKLKFVIELKEKYNAGKISLADARKQLKERVKTLKPYEIAYAEQKLTPFVEDECIKENIQNMMLLFDEVMDTSRPSELPDDHPIMCYFRENDDMRELLKEVENLIQFPVIKNQWYELYDKLDLWWKLHLPRKQNQLYSLLEKKGFTRPTTTMWVLDDFVRDELKENRKMLDDGNEEEFIASQTSVAADIIDLIRKEETVLYPTSLAMISEEEFEDMKSGDREIGFTFGELETVSVPKKVAQDSTISGQGNLAKDLAQLLGKYGFNSGDNQSSELDVAMGKMTLEQINLVFKHLPVDITYVDENEIVKFYSDTAHRVFPRSKNVIGRDVKNCHPRKSVHIVEEIIEKFRSGEQDFAEFWINKPGLFIYISYSAVKDENGKFRGILEMMQDCTKIRSLEGSQTLLNWESTNSANKTVEEKTEESDVKIDLDKIDGNTYLKDLIKVYPKLKDDMIKISNNFKLLQTPLLAVMLPTVTLKKASEKGEVELNTLIEKIKEIIKTY
ncbi:PAS domain-containing protein [Fusobacterium canifelinum]|uniref:PAS domain-containing protein n=1 Tax=Fusobacterium canifelinum TaxID=285729 RepID=A0A7T4FPW2_9FUSO|nr:PAS domain-containing protein [Fusobacterium canifelinum]QQB74517.1 PAS domain-containing protein [Fusobacterium canifelinum]